MHDTQEPLRERALLIGLERPGHDKWAVKDSLEELRELAVSAGAEVLNVISQKRDSPAAATFIGTGKVEELAARCRDTDANIVIFDDDLSPAQGRNLSEILGLNIKVIDRTELILDIFAQRARTREGKIQVELAQLHYMLPRLAGLWTHLSRQRGGVGSRGPGEQQLEVDRRRVQEKIHRLEHALDEVRKNRRVERGSRAATALAAGVDHRVHKLGQEHVNECVDGRGRARGRQAVRDTRSDGAQAAPAEQPEYFALRHGRLSAQVATSSRRIVQGNARRGRGGRSAVACRRCQPSAGARAGQSGRDCVEGTRRVG